MVEKKRSIYWDNMKGFLILLVVFSHFLWGFQNLKWIRMLVAAIYMFHMPAFTFISGYFSKNSYQARGRDSALKLIIAYFLFNGLFIICSFVVGKELYITNPYYSYWYIIALIVWRSTVALIDRGKYTLPLLFAAAILSGFWPDIDNTFALSRIIAFYPFFYMGYKFSEESAFKFIQMGIKKKLFALAPLVLVAVVAEAVCYKYIHTTEDVLLMSAYESGSNILARVDIFLISCIAIIGLLYGTVDKKLPLLTTAGRNSLAVYLIHRPVTFIYNRVIVKYFNELIDSFWLELIVAALACTIVLTAVCSRDIFSKFMDDFLKNAVERISKDTVMRKRRLLPKIVCVVMAVIIAAIPVVKMFMHIGDDTTDSVYTTPTDDGTTDPIYTKMSYEQQQQFDNAFKILFAGDLILLEDQVKNAYDGSGYNFNLLFEYTKPYISSADLAIGVFEGPMGGEEAGFSTSNYGDGKRLALSFPDSFAKAIQDSGFNLVTTANNHLLDKGVSAAERTLDVLDDLKLDHIGSYRNQAEKEENSIKIMEQDGIKIAVLAYTYGTNYHNVSEFVDGNLSYITSVLVDPASTYFEEVKESVKRDFEKAKSYDPDLIIVLPHMGTQFADEPNDYQKTWCDVFYEYGADIILGDHTHSVQPIEVESVNGKTHFTAYCPGNYVNIYREYNGDAASLIEVYIDRNTKQVIGGAVIPMWIQSQINGNYRALPIYDILNNEALGMEISTNDLVRVDEIHSHITQIMLGTKLDISMVRDRYYFTQDGFLRTQSEKLELTDEMRSGVFYNALEDVESVCFIGDSVTEGTKNGGYPWYEPLEDLIDVIFDWSKGSSTTVTLLDNIDEIKNISADLYVIAIGTNDVRYRNENICAMTPEAYTENLQSICDAIKSETPNASFVFIAPWISTDGDKVSKLNYAEKIQLNKEYSQALELFCEENNYVYIDANTYIGEHLERYPASKYLMDHIHPNSTDGIRMYSEAVMLYKE